MPKMKKILCLHVCLEHTSLCVSKKKASISSREGRPECSIHLLLCVPPKGTALSVASRLSVPCPRFSRIRKAVETSNLVATTECWTRVTSGANLRSKVKGQGHWERKSKNRFCAYLRQKWIDLRQTNTNRITGHSAHIIQ